MVLLNLVFGILCIYTSGIVTMIALKEKSWQDVSMVIITFLLGIYLLISSIGAAVA